MKPAKCPYKDKGGVCRYPEKSERRFRTVEIRGQAIEVELVALLCHQIEHCGMNTRVPLHEKPSDDGPDPMPPSRAKRNNKRRSSAGGRRKASGSKKKLAPKTTTRKAAAKKKPAKAGGRKKTASRKK